MALLDTLLAFALGLVVGAFGIYVGGRVVTDIDDYTYAIITALLGAIAWAIADALVGGIVLLGPVLVLAVWILVISFRYPGGITNAVLIGLVAWVVTLLVGYALTAGLGLARPDAIGIPGV